MRSSGHLGSAQGGNEEEGDSKIIGSFLQDNAVVLFMHMISLKNVNPERWCVLHKTSIIKWTPSWTEKGQPKVKQKTVIRTPQPTKDKKQKAAKKKTPKKLVKKRNHSSDDDTTTGSDSSTDSDNKKKVKKPSKIKHTRKVSSSDEGSESSSDSDSVHHKKKQIKKHSHNTSKKRKLSSDDGSSDNTSEQSDGWV